MALENPRKRKSVLSSSTRGKSFKRGKHAASLLKKGKSISLESKKRVATSSASSGKRASNFQESKAFGMISKLIDSGTLADHEPVFYLRKKNQSVMKEGRITREGVLCSCCNRLFLLSKFEAHAGSGLHRPSANMFLRDGRSLMECYHAATSMQACYDIPAHRQSPLLDASEDSNDNICQICGDGGELMLCDSCPSAFHYDCLHLDAVPEVEEWHCSRCRCGSCGLGKGIENGQDGESMLSCAHCQVPYHESCVSGLHDTAEGRWFCTKTCQDIYEKLRRLVGCVFPLEGDLSWTLLRASEEEIESVIKGTSSKKKLAEALKLLQQCFDPILDHETGMDVLSQVVFNQTSHVKRLDCSAFYTMLLMKGEQLVSVATLRTHGKSLAEMPFIGTGYEFRQQGMCKALMQALETMLWGSGVYKLIIPSINEVIDTWTSSFGFRHPSPQDRNQISGTNLLSFPGTTLLSKRLLAPGLSKCQEPMSDRVMEAQERSIIQDKEKIVPSNKALSNVQPISCH